jgi:hypothetical protein
MGLLQKIQSKPHEEKVRLIIIIAVITGIVLFALWILTANWDAHTAKDTSLFQTIGRGIRDLRK